MPHILSHPLWCRHSRTAAPLSTRQDEDAFVNVPLMVQVAPVPVKSERSFAELIDSTATTCPKRERKDERLRDVSVEDTPRDTPLV